MKKVLQTLILYYVYLKSLFFLRSHLVIFFISFVCVIHFKKFKIYRLRIRTRHDLYTLLEVYHFGTYSLKSKLIQYQLKKLFSTIKSSKKKLLLMDLGGNLGFASRYFQDIIDNLRIISIEPDARNLDFFEINAPQAKAILGFVGPSKCMVISNEKESNSNNIFSKVESGYDQVSYKNVSKDLNLLLNDDYVPFIIKVDIEGAEKDLFLNHNNFLSKFPVIFVEVHDWLFPEHSPSHSVLSFVLEKNYLVLLQGDTLVLIKNDT